MKWKHMTKFKNVIWITGMSASGKTTLAHIVTQHYKSQNIPVIWLDGDELRKNLKIGSSFDREDRLKLAFQYAGITKMLSDQGFLVVISTVALHKEIHQWNRQNIPGYFEVFLKCEIMELKRRDPKGLYAAFDRGEQKNIVGLDIMADFPKSPDLIIETSEKTDPEKSKQLVVNMFQKKFLENS